MKKTMTFFVLALLLFLSGCGDSELFGYRLVKDNPHLVYPNQTDINISLNNTNQTAPLPPPLPESYFKKTEWGDLFIKDHNKTVVLWYGSQPSRTYNELGQLDHIVTNVNIPGAKYAQLRFNAVVYTNGLPVDDEEFKNLVSPVAVTSPIRITERVWIIPSYENGYNFDNNDLLIWINSTEPVAILGRCDTKFCFDKFEKRPYDTIIVDGCIDLKSGLKAKQVISSKLTCHKETFSYASIPVVEGVGVTYEIR